MFFGVIQFGSSSISTSIYIHDISAGFHLQAGAGYLQIEKFHQVCKGVVSRNAFELILVIRILILFCSML